MVKVLANCETVNICTNSASFSSQAKESASGTCVFDGLEFGQLQLVRGSVGDAVMHEPPVPTLTQYHAGTLLTDGAPQRATRKPFAAQPMYFGAFVSVK